MSIIDSNFLKALPKVYVELEADHFETKEEYEEHHDYDVWRIVQKVTNDLTTDIVFNFRNVDRADIIGELLSYDVGEIVLDELSNLELVLYYYTKTFNATTMENIVNAHFVEQEQEQEEEEVLIDGGGLPQQ